jgi:hypothetical protein
MAIRSEYVAGWIDTTIHDFLSEIEEPSSSMGYVLITCLDSCFDVASLVKQSDHLAGLNGQCRRMGNSVWLTIRQLLAAERRGRIFFGFDEIWFFPHPPNRPKPPEIVITGPNRINDPVLDRLTGWMQSSGCSLGLGDGTGMNFCARLRGVARHLVSALSEANSTTYDAGSETL